MLDVDYSSDDAESEKKIYMTTRSQKKYNNRTTGRKINSESQKEENIKRQTGLQKARETRKKNNRCATCGDIGHFATECPNNMCGKCASLGKRDVTDHLSKHCPYLTEDEKGK